MDVNETEKGERKTPSNISNATNCTNSTKMETKEYLDGVMILGDSLAFIQPGQAFQFKKDLSVTRQASNRFKGLTDLTNYPILYEVSLGHTDIFELSLIIGSTFDKDLNFKSSISRIQNTITVAILSLPKSSCTVRIFNSTFRKNAKIAPADWLKFSHKFSSILEREFTITEKNVEILFQTSPEKETKKKSRHGEVQNEKLRIYFIAKRMGQDLFIKITYLDWEESSKAWKDIALPYKEIQMASNSTKAVAVHVATDMCLDQESNEFIMWDVKSIQKELKQALEVYNVFGLPGLGNVIYDYTDKTYSLLPKHIKFYTRCGHQYHRNKSVCFKEPHVAKKLTEAVALVWNSKVNQTELSKKMNGLSNLLKNYKVFDAFIDQVELPTAARCEIVIVYENVETYSGTNLRNMGPCKRDLHSILKSSFKHARNHVKEKKLTSPDKMVHFEAKDLSDWLKQTLLPCKKMLHSITKNVLSNLRVMEKSENKEHMLDSGINRPEEYQNVLIAEALITYFLKGELSNKWPKYISMNFNLDRIKEAKLGDTINIQGVRFFEDKIDCNEIPVTNISRHLLTWTGEQDSDNFGILLTLVEEYKANKNKTLDQKILEIRDFSKEFLRLLVIKLKVDHNRNPKIVDEIDFKLLDKHENQKSVVNSVKSATDFAEMIRNQTKNTFKGIFSTLFCSISSLVKDDLKKQKSDFAGIFVDNLTEEIIKQKCPFYYPTNMNNVVAVLPDSDFTDELIIIYTNAFKWCNGTHMGIRAISCEYFFRETLDLFLKENKLEIKKENKLGLQSYFAIVNTCLKYIPREEELGNLAKPGKISKEMTSLLINYSPV